MPTDFRLLNCSNLLLRQFHYYCLTLAFDKWGGVGRVEWMAGVVGRILDIAFFSMLPQEFPE